MSPDNLVVGDVLILGKGKLVPAECILISSSDNFSCDDSELTGEEDPISKDCLTNPFLYKRTKVVTGEGKALVIGVGSRSLAPLPTDEYQSWIKEHLTNSCL